MHAGMRPEGDGPSRNVPESLPLKPPFRRKNGIMHAGADDIEWVSEARMFSLCELPRSTFQSWVKAGFDIQDPGGAYGLDDVLEIALLVQARRYLGLEELAGGWRQLTRSGVAGEIVVAARELKEGEQFDLVLEPEHASIVAAGNNDELIDAVRHPGAPRPVVVLAVSGEIQLIKESFARLAKTAPRPAEKRRGRPRRQSADVAEFPSRSKA